MNPLFIKLMMLTTSDNDSEALSALRKANAILAQANVNWSEFLSAVQSNKVDNSFRTPPSQRQQRRNQSHSSGFSANAFSDVGGDRTEKFDDAKIINPMFEQAFKNAGNSSFRDFLDSVHEWWEDKGFLTEKQYYSVKKAADR